MYSGKTGKVESFKIGLKFLNPAPDGLIVEILGIPIVCSETKNSIKICIIYHLCETRFHVDY